MGRPKKLKALFLSVFKDKASLIKATLSTNRTTSSIRVAVIRATTHSSTSPPQEHRLTTILSLGQGTRFTASTCIVAIMDRLHSSHNAYVALKSLLTLHYIITKGSFILKDQLSFYPSTGGQNFLNLSHFIDKTNIETREFSLWVRWYASVLESNLITSRVLGCYVSSSSTKADIYKLKENLTSSLNSDLLREIDSLVVMVEEICQAPESLDYQRNELVYEIMRMVSEDYRMTQYHTMIRLTELGERTNDLSPVESDELTSCLKRFETYKKRLTELFVNRKRNDAFWDLISEVKGKLARVKEEREKESVKRRRIEWVNNESTQLVKRILGPSQPLRLLPGPHRGDVGNWASVDRVNLTVSTATA